MLIPNPRMSRCGRWGWVLSFSCQREGWGGNIGGARVGQLAASPASSCPFLGGPEWWLMGLKVRVADFLCPCPSLLNSRPRHSCFCRNGDKKLLGTIFAAPAFDSSLP